MTHFSIIICTRNRAKSLKRTLEAIDACRGGGTFRAELLVVDNASTDETQRLVEEATLTNMPVRYLREERRGQVFARNAGIDHAGGDVIVFTDDDVRPDADWLVELDRAFAEAEVMAVQGKVVCVYDPPLPEWYDPAQLGGLADVDLGNARRSWISNPCVGANMAFRRTVVDRIGKFRTCLGPGRSGFFDDTEFSWRMQAVGLRIDYVPEASVYHHPVAARLTRNQLRKAWFQNGLSSALAEHCSGRTSVASSGPSLIRRLVRVAKLKTIALLVRSQPRLSQDEMFLWMHCGAAYARLRGLDTLRRQLESEPGEPADEECGQRGRDPRSALITSRP